MRVPGATNVDAGDVINELIEALMPFAAMHRDGSDEDEMACQRGTASDATFLFSRDFEKASTLIDRLLEHEGDCDCEKCEDMGDKIDQAEYFGEDR